jgi:Tol biopolymer transport system component
MIVFSNGGDIWTVQPGSVAKTRLTTEGSNFSRQVFPDGFNRNPVWSPDGKQIAFASARDLYLQPHYDNGYELYIINSSGGGLQRVSQLADSINTQRLPLAWLSNGDLLIKVVSASKQRLALFNIATHQESPLPVGDAQFVAYSPDKANLAYAVTRPGKTPSKTISDLLVVSVKGGTSKNITNSLEELNSGITELAWSPEGARLAYIESSGDACGNSRLYLVGADGSGKIQIKEGEGLKSSLSWSPDGTRLLYGETLCTGETTLKMITLEGSQLQTLTEGQNPQWNTR